MVHSKKPLLPDFKQNEQVVAIIRRHWFVLVRDILGLAVLYAIPFLIVPFVLTAIAQNPAVQIPGSAGLVLGSLWSLLLWNMLFAKWTDYYYDIWIITNQRIIDIDQKGFFHRDIATLFDLGHIQDVKTVLSGVVGNILNFGLLQVQTAAAHKEFFMSDIANPGKVEKIIRKTQHELYLQNQKNK
ncbi:hypothetical protein COU15_00685 [Candidatus Kaiserbacteria bacterium CG10_big_fil_rev_8_21_14_0_10_45_20]|uniref:DUF304 domain-containing protein n=1 Tax=Candidatus Kaiserbacteria bacterium CG10_big_fil_rev_8_21_14_0_10_45_20 TaxID=1974607 RepID=A0A2H0UG97_9BACT|nr:MAG: hypothetical protein COU15_00685 [Candidatus Kaiserbacteria bacterium CG10_big_fil_rev_8_21_14_0_10_45_20]